MLNHRFPLASLCLALGFGRGLFFEIPARPLCKSEGVDVRGKDPANTLAAALSNDPRFYAVRGVGWFLREEKDSGDDGTEPSDPDDGDQLPLGATNAAA